MSKATLNDYDYSYVPLSSANFAVMIANYPELGPMAVEMEIPSRSTGRLRVELFGKSKVWPGRRISSSNEINITLLLNRRTQTYKELLAIQDSFSEGVSGNIVGRFFDIKCINYDEAGIEAMAFTFRDCWLAEIGSFTNSGESEGELIRVPCVFGYAETSYAFTGMASTADRVITTVLGRVTGLPITVADVTGRYGEFGGMNNSMPLQGTDTSELLMDARQKLSEFAGLSMDDITNMRDVVSSVRSLLGGAAGSKFSEIKSAIKSKAVGSAISTIKSFF